MQKQLNYTRLAIVSIAVLALAFLIIYVVLLSNSNDLTCMHTSTTVLPEASKPVTPTLGSSWIRSTDGMKMVYVPGGEFSMGSDDDAIDYALQLSEQDDCNWCSRITFENEQPVHTVTLDGFWIDQTEVTNAQYCLCVGADVCKAPKGYPPEPKPNFYDSSKANYPVTHVSWEDAQTYCEWAGARLLTEAEWEYAARGTKEPTYPWGEDRPNCELARFWACAQKPSPVGSARSGASWCGAWDMAGNISEWVADWYGPYPSEHQVNPIGPSFGYDKVTRGGSCFSKSFLIRSAIRSQVMPDHKDLALGFRCAVSSD